MATLTPIVTGVGEGAQGPPIFGGGSKVTQIRTYSFDFDNSYPTGGESISDIWTKDFGTVLQIFVNGALPDATNGRFIKVDYTNKKLMVYTALDTQAAGSSDQSAITGVKLTVIGYPR
jgi:hypothetical protein